MDNSESNGLNERLLVMARRILCDSLRIAFLLVVLATLVLNTSCSCQATYVEKGEAGVVAVGLPTDVMDYYAAEQHNSMWCWAASIQMVLSAQGVNVRQEDIVAEVFGDSVNEPGNAILINSHFNGRIEDTSGIAHSITTTPLPGPPPLLMLISRLREGKPIIIGYQTPGQSIGHAVVVTAVIYEEKATDRVLHRVQVRDPWPDYRSSKGKRSLTPTEFYNTVVYYVIDV